MKNSNDSPSSVGMACLGVLVPLLLVMIMLYSGLWDGKAVLGVYYAFSVLVITGYYLHPGRILWAMPVGYGLGALVMLAQLSNEWGLALAVFLAIPHCIVTIILSVLVYFGSKNP